LELIVPSLNPIRLRLASRRCCLGEKPSWVQRSVATSGAIRAMLRTAWNATCGSSAQAWRNRSPSLSRRDELVAGEVRQRDQRGGSWCEIPNRSAPAVVHEQRPAEPDRQRQPRRPRAR
jgi:hypothetical protein